MIFLAINLEFHLTNGTFYPQHLSQTQSNLPAFWTNIHCHKNHLLFSIQNPGVQSGESDFTPGLEYNYADFSASSISILRFSILPLITLTAGNIIHGLRNISFNPIPSIPSFLSCSNNTLINPPTG